MARSGIVKLLRAKEGSSSMLRRPDRHGVAAWACRNGKVFYAAIAMRHDAPPNFRSDRQSAEPVVDETDRRLLQLLREDPAGR